MRRAEAIRRHLDECSNCRDWILRYDDFTREILEAEPSIEPNVAGFPAGEDPPLESGSPGEKPWLIRYPEAAVPPPGAFLDTSFANRVMAGVRRIDSWRRLLRFSRIAAAILIFAGLGIGGLFWLAGWFPKPESPLEDFAASVPPPSPILSGDDDSVPPPASQPRPDLASALWMIHPDQERDALLGRAFEAMLFSPEKMETTAPGESLDFLMLRALLGLSRTRNFDSRFGSNFLMVPAESGERSAIPVRPTALPVRVPAREIATPTRLRLKEQATRYRIIWTGTDGFQAQFKLRFRTYPSPQGFPFSTDNRMVELLPLIEN